MFASSFQEYFPHSGLEMDPPDRYGYDLYAGSQILFGNENWHFLRIGMENCSPPVLEVG